MIRINNIGDKWYGIDFDCSDEDEREEQLEQAAQLAEQGNTVILTMDVDEACEEMELDPADITMVDL